MLCMYPGCTLGVMFTQLFPNHIEKEHGEKFYEGCSLRDQYEVAIDDPRLLDNLDAQGRLLMYRMQKYERDIEALAQHIRHLAQRFDHVNDSKTQEVMASQMSELYRRIANFCRPPRLRCRGCHRSEKYQGGE